MKTSKNNTNKVIGIFLILGSIALFIPYTILIIIFEYPDILRQETSLILIKFHNDGARLIWTWFAFAMVGLPILPAFLLIGNKFGNRSNLIKIATSIGVIGLVVQMIGFLRWVFVVPMLADLYVNSTDPAIKAASIVAFKTIHQFAGVILGEHLGQLFSIIWTILLSVFIIQQHIFQKWMAWFGIFSSAIYILAQTELFNTVMPNFPQVEWAGFVGSTLWLIWMIILGIKFFSLKDN